MKAEYGLRDIWAEIILSIEKSALKYSRVNKLISLGVSNKLRYKASIDIPNGVIVDAGCGPGDMALNILQSEGEKFIIGLDADYNLIKIFLARAEKLGDDNLKKIDLVVGLFEEIPIRDSSIDAVVTSFSLRDSMVLEKAIKELHRILREGGWYLDVDIGRPCNRVVERLFHIYLKYIPPILASLYYGSLNNPWKTLYKTLERIPDNKVLARMISKYFNIVNIDEVACGAMIKISAIK